MKKVRIYFPEFPYPVTAGAPFVVDGLIRRYLREGSLVELVTWKQKPFSGSAPANLATIQLKPGEPLKESSLERISRVLLSFFGSSSSQEEGFYAEKHIESWRRLSPVELAIYNYGFSWNWLSQSPTARPPENRRVVFHHNLESTLSKQRAKGVLAPFHLLNTYKLKKHEVCLGDLVDENWFISEPDLRDWIKMGGNPNKALIHFPDVFDEDYERIRKARQLVNRNLSAPSLGFLGRLDFGPNAKGLSWILNTLCPILKKRDFRGVITIVGPNASQAQIKKMAHYSFVRFEGFQASLDSFWTKIDWLLAPHLEGSGVRVKLIESLMYQIPTLTHEEAASRLEPSLRNSQFLRVSEDPCRWANLITQAS